VDSGEALTSGGASVVTRRAGSKRRIWLVGGAVVAALGLAVGSLLVSRNAASPAPPLEIKPFTADGGWKTSPRLSPDGEKVAYHRNGDIYVKGVGVGTRPLRLTENPAWDRSPEWSPDGRQIAFVRHLDEGPAIYAMPWPSGQERRLDQLTGPAVRWGGFTTLSWSPDGASLAFAEKPSEDEPSRIVRLTLATLEKEPLTSPPKGAQGDFHPSYSPDGNQLAFARASGSLDMGDRDVWVQSLQGGEARRVTFEGYNWCWVSSWTVDGREVLFTVFQPYRLLRAGLKGGDPRPIPGVGEGAAHASIRKERMVYAQHDLPPQDIWRMLEQSPEGRRRFRRSQ
jgi:Tol biopolymer transport system component